MTDFASRLESARAAGRERARRQGHSIRAAVTRALDAGIDGDVEVLLYVLADRDETPAWLMGAEHWEINALLSTWGSVRHALAQARRVAKRDKSQNATSKVPHESHE